MIKVIEDKETKLNHKKLSTLFTKQKKLIGTYYKAVNIKEPALIMLRNTREADFFEGVTKGEFEFEHSDGTKRIMNLSTAKKFKFPYLDREFTAYIAHEDEPFPLPSSPLITSDMFRISHEKTLNDIRKHQADEIRAKQEWIWTLGKVIMGIIAMYILYVLLFGVPDFSSFGQQAQTVAPTVTNIAKETGKVVIHNVTKLG